jgi:alkylhydroperoxidase/carboxymuconolactone decarboxylase family protein YurZ
MSVKEPQEGGRGMDRSRQIFLESVAAVPVEVQDDWARLVNCTIVDGIWARPNLPWRLRSLITIAALATLRCRDVLKTQIRVARRQGLSRRVLCEVMLQVGGYAGFGIGQEGMLALKQVLDEEPNVEREDVPVAANDGPLPDEDRLARGTAILAILRPDRAGLPPPPPKPFAPDWRTWLVETAFGDLWARPHLSLIDRERVTLAVLIALSREEELRSHVQIARNVGIPPLEIGEQIMHLAIYVGFPTAVAAIRIAGEVLEEGG